jgi:hypothetical protein
MKMLKNTKIDAYDKTIKYLVVLNDLMIYKKDKIYNFCTRCLKFVCSCIFISQSYMEMEQ